MSIFTKWFSGKSAQDENLILSIIDQEKSKIKRYNILIAYIEKISKKRSEKFNARLYDFFKEYNEIATMLTIANLIQTEPKLKLKLKSWGEVEDNLTTLIELTRYGFMKNIEDAQEIAKCCLQDSNRLELRELGFSLVLNILTHNSMLQFPFDIYQAAIDLSHFSVNNSIQLNNRQILGGIKEPQWLITVKEYLHRISPYNYSELNKILSSIQLSEIAKENFILFKKLLEFTVTGGVTASGINLADHFLKWLQILKKSYLLLLYPDISDENYKIGFNQCPEVLHFNVIYWITKFISIEEISSAVFSVDIHTKFVIKILEKSFIWFNSENSLSNKSAMKTLNIFESWLNSNKTIKIKDFNTESFNLMIINHLTSIFDYKKDLSKRRLEACSKAISLLTIYQNTTHDKSRIFNNLLKICETVKAQTKYQEVIQELSYFILKTCADQVNLNYKLFPQFIPYLHNWSNEDLLIIQEWKRIIIEFSSSFFNTEFEIIDKMTVWLSYLDILGDPLNKVQVSQNEWACSIHEIALNLLEKNVSSAVLIKYLLSVLSRLILKGKTDSQKICLNTLCMLFTKKSEVLPSFSQVSELFRLLSICIHRKELEVPILEHSSKLLDYKGMHVLIKTLISIANYHKENGFSMIFRIFSFPNYYKATVLYSLDFVKEDYLSLKTEIFLFFKNSIKTKIVLQTIDGLTVFIAEEIANDCFEYIDQGLDLLLAECTNDEESIAIAAIRAMAVLIPVLPKSSHKILEFIVSKILKTSSFDKETLMKNLLDLTMCVLMNFKASVDEENLKILFSHVAFFNTTAEIDSKLRIYMDLFLSFLGFYYLNFPLKGTSVEIIDSSIKEPSSIIEQEHFSLNGNTIISIFKDFFIIRNEFGKFFWNCKKFSILNLKDYKEDKERLLTILDSSTISLSTKESHTQLSNSLSLELLIDYISLNYQHTNKSPSIAENPEILKKIENIEKKENDYKPVKIIKPEQTVDDLSKIFISNIGIMNDLENLETNENFEMSLRLLDNIKPREQVKIGVLYVKPGQDNEKEIFANDSCSLGFKEFITNLGKQVELESYLGNLGGLDSKGTCGKFSFVYTDWEYDVMFHVPVLMPTSANDLQQVNKKRHVGNDMVIIVWTENRKDYRQDTVITNFNFINIVIYPLEKQLFRIQILSKIPVEFGPLKDGMVVSWKVLPYLIRITAINANKSAKAHKHHNFDKQTMIRYKKIHEIIKESSRSKLVSEKFLTSRF